MTCPLCREPKKIADIRAVNIYGFRLHYLDNKSVELCPECSRQYQNEHCRQTIIKER